MSEITVFYAADSGDMEKKVISGHPEMKKIYEWLAQTKDIHIERNPRHSILTAVNSEYRVHIVYKNGKTDKFGSAENTEYIYRVIGNKENSYIIGRNKAMQEFIYSIQGDKVD